ncbi:restriction endonuclease subunit S [Flavobacterium filum]|uniref:restriction endonuclease subunit S n=1 Tax=Flavobacterium filum TaxID=370974 RepID=UPI0023F381DE|nr:restriction endonuclease subunit S [Flavobacterium filum]
MKKYLSFKEAIEKLISNLPPKWKVYRAKGIFNQVDVRSQTGEEQLLSVSEHRGVVPRNEMKITMFMAESYEGYKLCEVGDLVINSLWAWGRGIGISEYNGIVSTAYGVFRLKDKNLFSPKYLNYLLRTKDYVALYYMRSKGIWISRLQLQDKNFLDLPIICPPKDEQDEIVQYIKAQEEKINLFIQKKQRFIELLKEQRQRIINYSVTKGINPNAEMKDTGIEWLGEIPKHWQLRRLKNVAEVVLGKMLCNEDKGGYALKPYLKSKNIGWDKVIIEEVDEMWFSPKEMLTYRVKENDLLVSEGGEVGKTCIWKNELDECYIQNSVHKLTCFEDCLPEFYLFWMGMLGSVGYFRSIVNQVSIAHLTREKVVTVICLHPPLEEQKQIVAHIKTETATIDTAIAKAEREIELIREYKEAMIAEAVMGKRK